MPPLPRCAGEGVCVLVFDLGGVVCHFDRGRRYAALASLIPSGALTPVEVHDRLLRSDFYARADLGEFTAEEMIVRLREMLGIGAGDADVRAAWTAAFTPNPDVVDVVDRMRSSVRVAMLTDNPPLLRLGLDEVFPDLLARFAPAIFSYELGAMKPSPTVWAAVADRLAVPAGAICLIDDSDANVGGAREAGMLAIRYRDAQRLRADLDALLAGRR